MTDPAPLVAKVLDYIEGCRDRLGHGPQQVREFRAENRVRARIEGTEENGAVSVTVADMGIAWRLRAFATARCLTVLVKVDGGI